MPGIPQATIDRVLESTDIVEVIGSVIPLRKLGQNFQGLCPFHDDKAPSLSVSPEKKIFRCFGCGTGGNVITFLRKHKNIAFPEAVRLLADKAGIAVDSAVDKNREAYLFCLVKAQEEFARQLHCGDFRLAVNYLTERGIQPKTQEQFGLGYCGSVKALIIALKNAGIKEKEIPIGAGVLRKKDQGVVCPLRGRIPLPLADLRGTILGFGARAIDSSAHARYVNSAESTHFSKRRILYGLSEAEIANDRVLVVEGYFDVLTLHQAGFQNTVGLLGTEITVEQAAILNNLAREIIFIFDGDNGGQSALMKALRAPLKASVTKAVLLSGSDPDEFLREGRQAELEALIDKAKPLQDCVIEIMVRRKDREGIESLTEEIIKLAASIPDALAASQFAQEAAQLLALSPWAIDEKVHIRREKKEKLFERKRQLEKFLVSELVAKPDLFPTEKLESIKDLFDDGEQKQFLISRILKRA